MLKDFIDQLYKRKFNMINSGDEAKWNQTERNKLRSDLIDILYEDYKEQGFQVYRVDKGVCFEIPNEDEGVISFILSPTMCGLDYDAIDSATEYQEKIERKLAKQLERAKKKKA